jgi:uncharacterized Zn finger protein (UPF0148 family)
MSEHKCVDRVYSGHYIGSHTCNKTARYEHNGKWYCKTHHPPTVEEKRRAHAAKWEAKFEARMAQITQQHREHAEMQRKAAAYDTLLEALKEIANTDPVDAALDPQRAVRIARAAIKAVEEGK